MIQTATTEYPRLSLKERDRRYAAVRERMRRRGVDCVIVRCDSQKWDAGSAEGRYLSHIGGNGEDGYVVLDLTENAVFVLWGPDHLANWAHFQEWTTDIRPYLPAFALTVANRVKELGLEKSTIGLIGRLGSRLYRGDGRWPQGNFEMLRRELPDATFVDFDEELWAVMAVKSDEEIACIEKAMEVTEAGAEAMVKRARPGVRVNQVVGSILEAMLSAGSEMGIQVLLSAGEKTPRVAGRWFPDRVLQRGDMVINELTGKYNGYCAQIHAPVSVGQAPGAEYRQLYDLVVASFLEGEKVLKPGISTLDLAEAVRGPVARTRFAANSMPLFKGMGMTIAEPPYSPTGVGLGAGQPVGTQIEENMVLLFEPAAFDEQTKRGIHIAQQVVVTRDGSRRIGKRMLEFNYT